MYFIPVVLYMLYPIGFIKITASAQCKDPIIHKLTDIYQLIENITTKQLEQEKEIANLTAQLAIQKAELEEYREHQAKQVGKYLILF